MRFRIQLIAFFVFTSGLILLAQDRSTASQDAHQEVLWASCDNAPADQSLDSDGTREADKNNLRIQSGSGTVRSGDSVSAAQPGAPKLDSNRKSTGVLNPTGRAEEAGTAANAKTQSVPLKTRSNDQPQNASSHNQNFGAVQEDCGSYCRQLKQMANGSAPKAVKVISPAPPNATTEHNFVKNLLFDQVHIWESPFYLRASDARWIVPFAGITTGLIVTDRTSSFELSRNNHVRFSDAVANGGLAMLAGGSAGLYVLGKIKSNYSQTETGMLAAEAGLDSLLVGQVFKSAFGRDRPTEGDHTGHFFRGGQSFYSDHATVAWAAASVLASEYPGWFTGVGAYGAATAISLARVTGRQHYLSDVFVGAATGYLIGKHVYHAHHGQESAVQYGSFESEASRPLSSIASTYVPLDSWVYPALARLAALGAIRTQFMGLRPWTRLAIAEMLEEAENSNQIDTPESAHILEKLRSEFSDEIGIEAGNPSESIRLESVYSRLTTISGRPLNDSSHFGQTIINDFGRPYSEGFNEVSGFSGRAETGRFAVYLRGEYQHSASRPAYSLDVRNVISSVDQDPLQPATGVPSANQFRLLDAYVSTSLFGHEISVGKQSLWWGPDIGGAMLLGNNAEPFYMLRINRTTPVMLPGLSRFLGPFRYDNFFGQLAGHSFPRRPFYYGQKVSFKPTENLEFGFSRTAVFAGEGITPLTFSTFFHSFTSVTSGTPAGLANFRNNPGARMANFDFSYRVPGFRDWLTLYSDSAVHDDVSPVDSPHRAAISPGLYLAKVPKLSKLDFRVEAMSTDPSDSRSNQGKFVYWESLYHDGQTNKGKLLGPWIGREGKGGQAWLTYWLSPASTIQFGYRNAKIAKDFIPEGGTQNDYFGRAAFRLRNDLELSGGIQFESWLVPLLDSNRQLDFSSSIQVKFWPESWRK